MTWRGGSGTLAQQIARSFTSVVGSAIDGIAESMSGLIRGTMDWADALRNVAQTMGTAVVNAISRMFAEWLVGRAMMAVKNILFSQQEGAADAAAKAPGALMSSISSYGVAALVGTAALFAAIAAMSGAFAQGGVVRGPGGPKEDRVLARLSPGEYVIPAERVSQYGTEFFERIRQGQDVVNVALARASAAVGSVNVAGLRDYGQPALQAVEGQLRQITAETALLDAVTGGSRDAAPASSPVDPSKLNLSLVLVDSRNQARQFLESAEGEARLVEIIRKRRMQVGIPT
ncbi:MAG: hypothetical protein M5U12_06765 [Verrucomicrobia bacterium]|nr:hypothetical protein [Verrucomicrobiota bacterium]